MWKAADKCEWKHPGEPSVSRHPSYSAWAAKWSLWSSSQQWQLEMSDVEEVLSSSNRQFYGHRVYLWSGQQLCGSRLPIILINCDISVKSNLCVCLCVWSYNEKLHHKMHKPNKTLDVQHSQPPPSPITSSSHCAPMEPQELLFLPTVKLHLRLFFYFFSSSNFSCFVHVYWFVILLTLISHPSMWQCSKNRGFQARLN